MANEAYFIRQRSLLHLPSKPVAFLTGFFGLLDFLTDKNLLEQG